MTKERKAVLSRIIAALTVHITLAVSDHTEILPEWFGPWGEMALYLIPYILIGWDVVYRVFRNIRNGQVFDESFLMTVATSGVSGAGEYSEAVAVMLFYQVGELFQSYATNRSGRSITELVDTCPECASIKEDGQLKQADPNNVQVKDVIMVKSGEKIPLDGKIVPGDFMVNTPTLTGESVPRKVAKGDDIVGGYVNDNDLLRVQVVKELDDSAVAKILELVENASSKKARVENFITRFARYCTPPVVIGAVLLAVILPLFFGQTWSEGVRKAYTFLVISCSCALVTPVSMSFFSGIGATSKKGAFVKGNNHLETLSGVDTIVFGKTGTLTKEGFKVTEIHAMAGSPVPETSEAPQTKVQVANQPSDKRKRSLLELVVPTKSYSDHPISRSTKDTWGDTMDLNRVSSAREISGRETRAEIGGHTVLTGNSRLMEEVNVQYQGCTSMGTVAYIALDGVYYGYIAVSGPTKDEAFEAVRSLKKAGVRRTIMLTGDRKKVEEAVTARLGLDKAHAELFPEGKMAKVRELLSRQTGKHGLIFVGGGTNDAPVLSRVDVGIAMGNMDLGAAIGATDIVPMDDNPARITSVVRISQRIISIVKQDTAFALGVETAVLLMGAVGTANMWEAVFADVGVSAIIILNAVRAPSL